MASKKSKAMVNTTATARLKQDLLRLRRDPVPYVTATFLPTNILEWHYVVRGPEKTPYEGGFYHGKLVFPREFPFKPPSIYMITPNGRFKVNTRLCLSISDFHPDTWNPAWSVSSILTGLVSFMVEKTPTLGSVETSDHTKRQLALQSLSHNLANKVFVQLFPETAEEIGDKLREMNDGLLASAGSGAPGASGAADAAKSSKRKHDSSSTASSGDMDGRRGVVEPEPGAAPGLFQWAWGGGGEAVGGAIVANLTNIVVILGVTVFAFTVRYVLGTVD